MQFDNLELPPTADFHVHLRDGIMMETVVPFIRAGGVDTVLVMPNLQPPITTVAAALTYRAHLQALSPSTTFLMTFYLHPSITPTTIAEAAAAGITGVKVYPAGVTTNSTSGILDYEAYYPVFEAMQEHNMVLNLHGEVPSTAAEKYSDAEGGSGEAVTVINAESKFLPTLHKLHAAFPRLRIVLEHCSTLAALSAVRACGPTVAATITAHHLWLTIDDWCGDAFNYCKPVAKTPADRIALLQAVVGGERKFFFGSDSAPHPASTKTVGRKIAAGIFTQGWGTSLVVGAVEEGIRRGWIEGEVGRERLEGFLGGYGREFYGVEGNSKEKTVLERKGERIGEIVRSEDRSVEVVPFRSGEEVLSLRWKS